MFDLRASFPTTSLVFFIDVTFAFGAEAFIPFGSGHYIGCYYRVLGDMLDGTKSYLLYLRD